MVFFFFSIPKAREKGVNGEKRKQGERKETRRKGNKGNLKKEMRLVAPAALLC